MMGKLFSTMSFLAAVVLCSQNLYAYDSNVKVNSIPILIVPTAKRIETTEKVCKEKLGVFKDCHNELRIEYQYTSSLVAKYAQSIDSAEMFYKNNYYFFEDGDTIYFIPLVHNGKVFEVKVQ